MSATQTSLIGKKLFWKQLSINLWVAETFGITLMVKMLYEGGWRYTISHGTMWMEGSLFRNAGDAAEEAEGHLRRFSQALVDSLT